MNIVTIDAGGTNTRVRADFGGESETVAFRTDPNDYIETMKPVFKEIWRMVDGRTIHAVGMSVAAALSNHGCILAGANLPGWQGRNPGKDMENNLKTNMVVVHNDARMAAWGEYANRQDSLIYVGWGTGIGVAVILELDGKPYAISTEGGHMTIRQYSPLRCGCGGTGHWESLVGGANFYKRFGQGQTEEEFDPAQMPGEAWNAILLDMACGIRSLSSLFPGVRVVLGETVSFAQLNDKRLAMLREAVENLPSTAPVPQISLAKAGPDAALIGADYLARQLVES